MAQNDDHILRADDNQKLTPLSEEEFEDPVSGAVETIDAPHTEIHNGRFFLYSGQVTLNNAATKKFLITVPNSAVFTHMIPAKVRATGEANIAIYEGPTVSNEGTPVTMLNRNRNSSNVNATLLKEDPTADPNGTLIYVEHFGSGQKSQGESRGESEFILKTNTKYLIIITSEAASNDISFLIDWYEHANLG